MENSLQVSLKQSPETKLPPVYKVSILNWLLHCIVILINVVIGGFSGEDLKRLAQTIMRLQVSNYTVRLHCRLQICRLIRAK